MNYRELLIKYIAHVCEREGATYLDDWDRNQAGNVVKFTDEEWTELQALDEEAGKLNG